MVSSRKQDKVTDTVAQLEKEPGCTVKGVVCHVGKPEHRKNLISEVKLFKKGRKHKVCIRGLWSIIISGFPCMNYFWIGCYFYCRVTPSIKFTRVSTTTHFITTSTQTKCVIH